tara:strand:- start:157 stop:390 length:234 start_codon:yes stop_codon:yes gene_type:complete
MALSKTQTKKLGGLLSVMFQEETMPSDILNELIKQGLVELKGNTATLTDQGNDERRRLSTLAGLNIAYSSERKEKSA